MQVDKIIIRGPNWVGDAVLAIPAMKALRSRFPNADITLLVRPWVAGVFTGAPFLDRVWSEPRPVGIPAWSKITREIRKRDFDLAVLFPNSFESALMMFLGRVPSRLGYATDGRGLLLTRAVAPVNQVRHQVHHYLDLVSEITENVDRPAIEIQATAEEQNAARQLLHAEGIRNGQPFLVLNPGAAYGSAKRWHHERFAETADRLSRDLGLAVVIIGSEAERAVAIRILEGMRSAAVVLNGKTALGTLIGVLSLSSLMLTNDSGPMHIAAALGIPTVAVFGSTDERVTGPCGLRTRIVKHPVECSPCLLRECPIDHRCMTRVQVTDVYRAARELLSSVNGAVQHA
jgi:lipopolysaccharide heptosyltransferase II